MSAALSLCLAAMAAVQFQQGSVTRPDGATIAYYVRPGSGPNLVLIPGSWGDSRTFDRLLDRLNPSYRVIVVELRGHGRSRPAAAQPTMELFADDVVAVTDALRLSRFYVGGHSIGGMLSIAIAGLRPDAVAGVISMEGWTHHAVEKQAFPVDAAPLNPDQAVFAKAQIARVRSTLTDAEIAAFASVWRKWDGLPILENTHVPILELWGDRSQPKPSRQLMRIPDRPNIQLVWMPAAGHGILIQCPDRVAAETNRFIEAIENTR